jgi:hypothetical protein
MGPSGRVGGERAGALEPLRVATYRAGFKVSLDAELRELRPHISRGRPLLEEIVAW